MKEPTTNKEWWANVNACWDSILENFSRCGCDIDSTSWPENSTGGYKEHKVTFREYLEGLRATKDSVKMHHYLNLLWMAAPDHRSIHSWPHWHAICDLCSESHCVYKDDPDYKEE